MLWLWNDLCCAPCIGLRRAGSTLLDLALPMRCLVCQTPVMSPGGLCGGCWPRLAFVEAGGPEPRRLVADACCTTRRIAGVSAAVVSMPLRARSSMRSSTGTGTRRPT